MVRALVVDDGDPDLGADDGDDGGPDLEMEDDDLSGEDKLLENVSPGRFADLLVIPGNEKNLACTDDAQFRVPRKTGREVARSRRKIVSNAVREGTSAEITHDRNRKKKKFEVGISTRTRRGLRSQAHFLSDSLSDENIEGNGTKQRANPVLRDSDLAAPVVQNESATVLEDSSAVHKVTPAGRSVDQEDSCNSRNGEVVLGIPALQTPTSIGQRCGQVQEAASGANQVLFTPTVRQNVNVNPGQNSSPISGSCPDLNDPISFPHLGSCRGSLSAGLGKGGNPNLEADSAELQLEASPNLSGSTVGDSLAVGGGPSQLPNPGRILPSTLLPGHQLGLPVGDRLRVNKPITSGCNEVKTWSTLLSKDQKFDGAPLTFFPPVDEGFAEIPEEVLVEGCEHWSNTLIGYVVGKRPYYEYLRMNLLKAWKLMGNVKILGLDKGFFLFQFENQEDSRMVLEDGPWRVGGKPLVIKTFDRFCEFEREEFSTLPVWVRIPHLDPRLWTNAAISRIASCIGKPLSIDAATSSRSRLAFARVCVEVDPFKPLPNVVQVRTPYGCFPQTVEYDWRPDPCVECRSIHHNLGDCPKRIPPPSAPLEGLGPDQSKKLPPKAPSQPDKEKMAWKVIQKKHRPSFFGPDPLTSNPVDKPNKFSLLAAKDPIPEKILQSSNKEGNLDPTPKVRKDKQIAIDHAAEARSSFVIPSDHEQVVRASGGAKELGHVGSSPGARPQLVAEVAGGLKDLRPPGNLFGVGAFLDPLQDGRPLAPASVGLGKKRIDSTTREREGNPMGFRKGFLAATSSYRLSAGKGGPDPP